MIFKFIENLTIMDYLSHTQAELSREEKIKDLQTPLTRSRKKVIRDYDNVVHNLLHVYQKVKVKSFKRPWKLSPIA